MEEEVREITDFSGWWDFQARLRPDRLALADSGLRLTWRQAAETAHRLSEGLLALGLKPDEVVASWIPHWVESYIVHVACEAAGLTWLPVPASLREYEVKNILERASPRVLFVAGRWGRVDFAATAWQLRGQIPELRCIVGVRLAERGDFLPWEDLLCRQSARRPAGRQTGSLILPTSGSTGMPKFAHFSAASWLLRGGIQAEIMRLGPADSLLAMTQGVGPSIPPLFAAPIAGSGVTLMGRLEAEEILDLIEAEKVTVVCAVPAQLANLARQRAWRPGRCRGVRLWYTTGAPMPPDLAEQLEQETSGKVLSGYGGMDFGGWAVPSLDELPEIRQRTVGQPRGGTEIRVVDERGKDVAPGEVGEIWGRGPCCALGYYKDEASRQEKWTGDGWFRTGDLGFKDPRANLVIVGRKKEIIRRGAQTIVPAELEQLLLVHPKILKAAVIGLPDPVMEERVCACVVLQAGCSFSFDEMVAFLKQKGLAPYKWPERLAVLADMELRGDKIDRRALRETVLAGRGAPERAGWSKANPDPS